MRDARDGGVGLGPAERLLRHLLVRDRLDDVGTGDEHRRRAPDHQDEVGDGGRVDGSARAGTHDGRDLRDDAGGERVAQEDVGVPGEGGDPFLDPRAARVVQADDGRARLHREVHHLADLRRVRLGERAAEDGEVLGEDEDRAPLDPDRAGHDAVARDRVPRRVHAEVAAAVDDERVRLLEGARVAEELDALARGELPGLVLLLQARLAAAEPRRLAQRVEVADPLFDRPHRARPAAHSGIFFFSASIRFALRNISA